MNKGNNNASRGGIGFFGLLGLLFIALKLTGYIDWPWWVVLSPVWGCVALWLIAVVLVAVSEVRSERRWRK